MQITNKAGEHVIFQHPTLLKIEGSVKMSLSNHVSIENEEAIFDEDITTLMVSAIEQNIRVPQGFVFGKLKQMREQYPLEKLHHDCKAQ